jgi:hypothetical protein
MPPPSIHGGGGGFDLVFLFNCGGGTGVIKTIN